MQTEEEDKNRKENQTHIRRKSFQICWMYMYFHITLVRLVTSCNPHPLYFRRLQTKGNKVNSFLRDCQDKPLVSMPAPLSLNPR